MCRRFDTFTIPLSTTPLAILRRRQRDNAADLGVPDGGWCFPGIGKDGKVDAISDLRQKVGGKAGRSGDRFPIEDVHSLRRTWESIANDEGISEFEILGSDAVRPPDWVMVQAATCSGPMLLTGEAGCDLDRLARAIHGMSSRRLRSPVEVATIPHDHAARTELMQQASKTSLILSLDDEGEPLDQDVVSKLFDARVGVRFIAIASSPSIARRALTDAKVGLMQHVPVRPLADRKDEIRKLLDRQFAKRAFCRRVNDLTPVNQDALKTYPWPGNFAELREVVDGIIAHATLGGLRPAAESLGISHQKLDRRFKRVGLKIRLFGQGE